MKKKEIVKRILFCLLACFLMGNWVPALAENASEQTEKAEAAERGRQALLDTGHADFLHFPKEPTGLVNIVKEKLLIFHTIESTIERGKSKLYRVKWDCFK